MIGAVVSTFMGMDPRPFWNVLILFLQGVAFSALWALAGRVPFILTRMLSSKLRAGLMISGGANEPFR